MVQCAKCGYLAQRKRETRELVDAEEGYRTNAEAVLSPHGRRFKLHEDHPICFMQAVSLREEIGEYRSGKALEVMQREHDCPEFTEWQQGFTPKEHLEMNLLEKAREAEREWRERDHQWQLDQAERDRKWRKEDRERDRRSFWGTAAIAIIAALIGVAGTLGAVFITLSAKAN